MIISILMYGSEIWILTMKEEEKLLAAERKILGPTVGEDEERRHSRHREPSVSGKSIQPRHREPSVSAKYNRGSNSCSDSLTWAY